MRWSSLCDLCNRCLGLNSWHGADVFMENQWHIPPYTLILEQKGLWPCGLCRYRCSRRLIECRRVLWEVVLPHRGHCWSNNVFVSLQRHARLPLAACGRLEGVLFDDVFLFQEVNYYDSSMPSQINESFGGFFFSFNTLLSSSPCLVPLNKLPFYFF